MRALIAFIVMLALRAGPPPGASIWEVSSIGVWGLQQHNMVTTRQRFPACSECFLEHSEAQRYPGGLALT